MKHNNAMRVLLSAMLILECLAIGSAQDLEWKTIRPRGEEFTAEMPGPPTRVEQIIATEKDRELAKVYDLVVKDVRFQVLSFRKQSPATPQDFSLFAERFQRAFLVGDSGVPKSISFEKNVVVNKRTAQQFQLKVASHDGLVRLYDGEHYFYAVMIIGGVESDSVVGRFLGSFKLGNLHRAQDNVIGEAVQPKNPPEPWSWPAITAPVNAGVLNGKATELPGAPYPDEAKRTKASGRVVVNVLVDEQGKVISTEAIEGPDELRGAATKAALKARFIPMRLMGQPVKVVGVLVYAFVSGP